MRIKSISADNLAGSSFEQPLAAITLLHGRNFAGKSTRINALALALCHKLPGQFETPRDVYENLATGNPLTVQCDADDGQFSGACWERDKKGKVSTTFEGSLEAPALLFCTNEFLDLSPKERTRFLFGVLPPPPLDKVGPDAIVAQLKNVKCDPHTEAHESAVNEFGEQIRASYLDAGDGMVFHAQEWLEMLVEEIATTTKEAKASAKTMRQTALGTVALRTDAPALGPIEAKKRKAQDEHTQAVAAESAALTDFSTAEKLYQEAKSLAAGYKPLTAQEQAERTKFTAERTELTAWLEREDVIKAEPTSSTKEAQAVASARAGLQHWSGELAKAEKELDGFKKLECCPTCKAKGKGWKDAVLDTLHARHIDCVAQVQGCTQQVSTMQTAFELAEKRVQDEALHRQTVRSHRDRLAVVDRALKGYDERETKAAPAKEADGKLPVLETASVAAGNTYTAAKQKRVDARKVLDEAETAHRLAVADAASARQAQQAAEKAAVLEAKGEVGQALRDMLHELLQTCVRLSIGPLLELCNDLCRGILPGDMAFVDGEVVITGRGPSHKSMSGTEKALLYCALSVGLATTSPLKLVILDELGRLDLERKIQLVNRIGLLISQKKIDQAILVDTRRLDDWEMPEGVELLQVEVKRS